MSILKNKTEVLFVVKTTWPDITRPDSSKRFSTYHTHAYRTRDGADIGTIVAIPEGRQSFSYDTMEEAVATAVTLASNAYLAVAFDDKLHGHYYKQPLRTRVVVQTRIEIDTLVAAFDGEEA